MLNISINSIRKNIDKKKYSAFSRFDSKEQPKILLKILVILGFASLCILCLPWTQNIRAKGYVTTLNPYDKPQKIQSLISGKIEDWYVKEGDIVHIGDTIVKITESKEQYLDPQLFSNTKQQQEAKSKSSEAYLTKRNILRDQILTLRKNYQAKINQLYIKQNQIDLKIDSDSLELSAALTYLENAQNQLDRTQSMFDKGIKPLKELETKRLSMREAKAKKTSVENKLQQHFNDKQALVQELDFTKTDYDQKIAKIESEIQSIDSYRYGLQGEVSKLQSKLNELEQRQKAYAITAPINGRVTKILKEGIGEFVKSQESIATIVPTKYQKAVELYVEPNDMPLIREGKSVRLQFDGWPAVVFSGWPDNSFGTFPGSVWAIDNEISDNGKYRILVVEESTEKAWPDLVRIGSGAKGLLLLNEVRIYYEIWRQLNGFPPDFYAIEKNEKVKNKAPLKKLK